MQRRRNGRHWPGAWRPLRPGLLHLNFLNLALGSPRLLNQLGLVVLDEGQFITDPNRGITVELIFALLLRARQRGVEPQLVILSAVIGNLNNFDRWLDLPLLISRERPVPLIEGVLDRRGTFQFVDVDGTTKTETLLPAHQIIQRRDKPGSQDVIVPLAKQLVAKGEKLLIFRNRRGLPKVAPNYFSKELGLGPATSVLQVLPTQDLTGASHDLRECLRGGTAFHNTNLLRAEREAIEKGYRNSDGGIHVLAATTTLAAGINTPASTVILAENEFVGEDGRPFTIAEYKNMAGRAGRLGYSEIGKAIILADTPIERAQLFQKYVLGTPEDVTSSFQQRDLPTWTLRLLSQVRGVRASDIPGLLVNTFGGYSASRANPQWIKLVDAEVVALVARLLQAGLAEQEGELIHLTLLGRACGSSSLSFESSLRLIELMKQLNAAHSRSLAGAGDHPGPRRDGCDLHAGHEARTVGECSCERGGAALRSADDAGAATLLPRRVRVLGAMQARILAVRLDRRHACRRAGETLLDDALQGAIGYGNIIGIADAARFHLRSAHQILSALFPDQPAFLAALDELLQRLEFGLPAPVLPLAALRATLTRGQYLTLSAAGCSTADDVGKLSREKLTECVGASTASLLLPEPQAGA